MEFELQWWQVALAAGLILINALVSLVLRLRLEGRLLIASVRMTVQLVLVGLVLNTVFQLNQLPLILLLAAGMTLIAGVAAVRRTEHRFAGVWVSSIVSVWASSWIAAGLAVLVIIRPSPWYVPQVLIPILGMILGNALNGISLSLDRLGAELANRRDEIDMLLAHGATRWEAARDSVQAAVRSGMIPILNTMAVAGIVSLPGMMTGQILSGVEPLEAVKYQIVIMFLIAAAASMGAIGVCLLSYHRLFSGDHQFRFDRLS